MDFGTKNAWAQYVRNRWPNNGVKGAMATWGLTEGQAKGLVYAQATQPTIDAVLKAEGPIGAFALGVKILAIQTGVDLEDFIHHQAEVARRERVQWEAEERRLTALGARVSGDGFGPRKRA